jgi:signal transduction histidine kinase
MFKFFKHITSKSKILLLSFLLILIPGAVISYMSLRSINQKADNLKTKYIGTVNLVRDKLESEFSRYEANFRNNVIESDTNTNETDEMKIWLRDLKSEYPFLKNLFLLNDDGGLVASHITYDWNSDAETPTLFKPQPQNIFNMAEEAEFMNKDFNSAIRFYKKIFNYQITDQGKALLLSRIGRCHYKADNYSKGIVEYRKILELKDKSIVIGSIPAMAVALFQIKEGYKALNDIENQYQSFVDLYRYLLDHPWDLLGGDYLFYLKTTSSELEEYKSVDVANLNVGDMDSILADEKRILEQISFLNFIKGDMLSTIRSDLKDRSLSESQSRILPLEENNSSRQIGYFRLPDTFQKSGIFAMGYEFEADNIHSNLFPAILQSIDLGRDVHVGILDKNDSLLYLQQNLPISNYLVAESFTKPLLNWKVALFDPEGKSVDQIVGNEQRLYLILFMGILFVMVVGIFIMVRAVMHESEVSRLKSEFVSSVSHELKTPLTLIRMFGETLDTGMVKDEKKRREFYSIIRKESERLSHLIDNVLDFSKMDTGTKKYHFEESDLVKVVRDSMEAYKFHIRDNGFEIESVLPDQEIELMIDRDAISQALLNLLSNAVKFSEDKKMIRVEVSRNADSAMISVSDHGVGIPKGELSKIFEKFYRVPVSQIEEKTGSGLGLALVKHIVDAHHGIINVHSELGKGSTFSIKIPMRWTSNT